MSEPRCTTCNRSPKRVGTLCRRCDSAREMERVKKLLRDALDPTLSVDYKRPPHQYYGSLVCKCGASKLPESRNCKKCCYAQRRGQAA